jgi:hypothetical protein
MTETVKVFDQQGYSLGHGVIYGSGFLFSFATVSRNALPQNDRIGAVKRTILLAGLFVASTSFAADT